MKHVVGIRNLTWLVFGFWIVGAGAAASAQNPSQPTFRSYAGTFLAADDHNFFVESELRLPLYYDETWGIYYRHRESTPFLELTDAVQAALLYTREEFQVDLTLNECVRLIAVGGYHVSHNSDRHGKSSALVFGGGLGSSWPTDGERLYWQVIGGGYFERQALGSDWWADAEARWRLFDFFKDEYLESHYRASLAIAADAETSNDGNRIRGLYRVGPQLQFLTAHGNRANVQLQWYHQDNNPFYGFDEDGVLLGLDIVSARNENYVSDLREDRRNGWFPVIWGGYDVAMGDDLRVSRFEMDVEIVDLKIAERLFTLTTWYETHQEHRIGDFDNVSYSVTLGVQTPIGLASILSHDDPLVAGVDFLHRSDHALNPTAARVAAVGMPSAIGPIIRNGSINILPRLRLQTIGWDVPYRDPSMYEARTDWLNLFDWRATVGYAGHTSRDRRRAAGQLGINWDVATIHGFVVYLRGVGSMGEETPDWLGEIGVRRPVGRVFVRYEDYGITPNIANGNIIVAGIGVNL